ncbi:MAG TPA: PEGA domain-containing protein [Polyangiaceae bacterium]
MRLAVIALLTTAACVPAAGPTASTREDEGPLVRGTPQVDAARELDQEGVRAFRDARFADAIRYFRAAFRLGGPSSELWNIARSHERMDDPESASGTIELYLRQKDLSPQDRADAERELAVLRSRSSIVTVTTVPSGATVTIDGKAAPSATPVSFEVRPGSHALSVHRDGYTDATRPFETRYGRGIIVSIDLTRAGAGGR